MQGCLVVKMHNLLCTMAVASLHCNHEPIVKNHHIISIYVFESFSQWFCMSVVYCFQRSYSYKVKPHKTCVCAWQQLFKTLLNVGVRQMKSSYFTLTSVSTKSQYRALEVAARQKEERCHVSLCVMSQTGWCQNTALKTSLPNSFFTAICSFLHQKEQFWIYPSLHPRWQEVEVGDMESIYHTKWAGDSNR